MTTINSLQAAQQFVTDCISYLGAGFHPDTPFEDYIDVRSGEAMYSPENAAAHNKLMEDAMGQFELADQDIYEYAFSLL